MRATSISATVSATVIVTTLSYAPGNARAASDAGPGPASTDPFEAYISAGASYEDNLFRFSDSDEAETVNGSDTMSDWYRRVSAGFRGQHAAQNQRYEYKGEINHQSYQEFDFLDYTGGSFTGFGEWELPADTTGNLQYGYDRSLQSFANKDNNVRDVVQRHALDAAIEKQLAQRWLLRLAGGGRDLDFSSSEFLSKRQADAEAELRYAASQQSVFGLLSTYTSSNFDDGDDRDFSGWSVGPTFEWQITSSLQLSSNLGYTHRGLDQAGVDQQDFDGVTGYAAALWEPGQRFSTELRVFRDVSSLGGEISEYTKRTGLRFKPTWQVTPKVTGRLNLAYEQRDFVQNVDNREDDYLLADLGLDFAATRKLLLTLAYGYEYRDSSLPQEDFNANLMHLDITYEI